MKVFATRENFDALRLEPYLRVTARRHPVVAPTLLALANRTSDTSLAVVHGDVSPKNILLAPGGPVFLDAECACFGDPAFDVAFCLTHLALKMLIRPDRVNELSRSADAFVTAHASRVTWESPGTLDIRVATLLPALPVPIQELNVGLVALAVNVIVLAVVSAGERLLTAPSRLLDKPTAR